MRTRSSSVLTVAFAALLFATACEGEGVKPPNLFGGADGGSGADGGAVAAADGGGVGPDAGAARTVELQLLSISDWHAQLDSLVVSGAEIGGAGVLSAYFKQERAANPNTLVLTGGDAFGASPPLSAAFNEEPAVKALNLMGLVADTFGNHNFDIGITHLQSMINLATYKFVSSNLRNLAGNLTGVAAPYLIHEVGGVKVGIIGITNPDAPSLLFPGRMGTLTIDPSPLAASTAAAAARAAGAHAIVVIAHLGITAVDGAGNPSGPLIEFAQGLAGVDVVLGDHTDFELVTNINGTLVVENKSKGRTYARVRMTVNTARGVTAKSAELVTPYKTRPRPADGGIEVLMVPDPAMETMLMPYRAQLNGRFDNVVGVATNVFPRAGNIERLGEVAIGNLVADAMRTRYGTQLAFTNGGGLRAPLPSTYAPANIALRRTSVGYAAGPPYDLVLGDVYAVLPFGNTVVTRTVTGSQLWAALEHSVGALPASNGRFLQISGFKFTYRLASDGGLRVQSVALDNGTPIARDATTYTVALPDFTNAGGDGYTMLADGQGASRDVMAEVVHDYIRAQGTLTPAITGRIVAVP